VEMSLISLYIDDIISNPSFAKHLFPISLLFLLSAEFMKQRNVLDLCYLSVPQVTIARNPSYRKNCLRLRGLGKTLCCIKISLESAGSPGVYPISRMHMILPMHNPYCI
jgi:hypothetical protein